MWEDGGVDSLDKQSKIVGRISLLGPKQSPSGDPSGRSAKSETDSVTVCRLRLAPTDWFRYFHGYIPVTNENLRLFPIRLFS